jgi:hypothetical protein
MSSDKKKESTIYTHYGTIPTSERRDHKAAQARVSLHISNCFANLASNRTPAYTIFLATGESVPPLLLAT